MTKEKKTFLLFLELKKDRNVYCDFANIKLKKNSDKKATAFCSQFAKDEVLVLSSHWKEYSIF